MTGRLEDIYTRAWFEQDFRDLGPEFDIVADGIGREFGLGPKSNVIDIGCGPALLMERLHKGFGCFAGGVEGSQHGIDVAIARNPRLRDVIRHQDLRTLEPGDIPMSPDVAICTEVAEHIEEEHAPRLVAILACLGSPVVWTAAPPGQEGHHHVNCKPFRYWEDLFGMHAMRFDQERTSRLQNRWRMLGRLSHMRPNLAVWT